MRKDDLLLSEAYSQVYNEGIWDRLKGQASGIGAGLKQGAQNLTGKLASATGNKVEPSGKTMGGSYANAQQTSLLNSFIKKAQKEVDDFNNDMSKMGAGNIQDVQKTHPQIAQQMQQVNDLIAYLKNPQNATPQAPAAGDMKEEPKELEASTPSGTGPITVQNPKTIATQQQATGGNVQGIPHGIQRNLSTNTNTSFSMANPQPVMKQVNQMPEQQPVQKAYIPQSEQPEQEAEIVDNEQKQNTGGTPEIARDAMEQQFGPSKDQTTQTSPNGSTASLNGVNYKKNEQGTWQRLTKTGDVQSVAAQKDIPELEKQAAAQKAQQDAGWKQTGAAKKTKTYK